MSDDKYKRAYERQKAARMKAENLLEERSRDLYESTQALRASYEKLKTQKDLIYHQDKLASVGLLGAGIAHEVNNPIGFIKSNLTTLSDYFQEVLSLVDDIDKTVADSSFSELQKKIELIKKSRDFNYIQSDTPSLISESLEGISRIETITKSLKDFSCPDNLESETFDLNECIRSALVITKSHTKTKAKVVTHLSDIPPVCGRPGSIGQVVLNLIINACHAISGYGEIIIHTERQNENVVFSVTDNGCGIKPENIHSIFDPFFTTKEIGKGTGLGLSVSHSIVQQHSGHIEVESTLNEGTTFRVYLPHGYCEADEQPLSRA